MKDLNAKLSMPNSSLVAACVGVFSDHAAIAAKLRALLLEEERPKGLDLDAVAKLHAAEELIYACIVAEAGAVNQRRAIQAEDLCVLLIQRPAISSAAAGLHARARLVLALIKLERSELKVCALNVAHAFAKDPRWSRSVFSEIFNTVFRPLCSSIYQKLEQAEAKALGRTYYTPLIAKRAGAVVVGTGVVAGALAVGVGFGALTGGKSSPAHLLAKDWLMATAVPLWVSADDDNARAAAVARTRDRHEIRIDQKCQELALSFL